MWPAKKQAGRPDPAGWFSGAPYGAPTAGDNLLIRYPLIFRIGVEDGLGRAFRERKGRQPGKRPGQRDYSEFELQ
jgi:hypothetical protein